MTSDPFNLQRFIEAQSRDYAQALAELKQGRKRSHWIWYVFPQIEGLGFSAMSQRYAIGSRAEAVAYLNHPVLGARLRECVDAVLAVEGKTITEILGPPDDLKFRSSMTLFAAVADDPSSFALALERYFGGERDPRTLQRLPRST